MPRPFAPVALSLCPICCLELASHPADGCTCTREGCSEMATTLVGKHMRGRLLPRCDRDAKADLVSAERFGVAVVLQAMPRDRVLPL